MTKTIKEQQAKKTSKKQNTNKGKKGKKLKKMVQVGLLQEIWKLILCSFLKTF